MAKLKPQIASPKSLIRPYSDVLVFMLALLVANYFWKFTFSGDEMGDRVTWLGMDVTAPFEWMACHIASVVYRLVSLCRDTVFMPDAHTIRFDNGGGTTIVWGCSGFKQMFIWFWLIFTVRNVPNSTSKAHLWLRKLWYIPLGWLCCYAFNILRIFLICLLIENHPAWFHPLHDYFFKYLFYGMLFLLWVVFIEKIRPPQGTDSV